MVATAAVFVVLIAGGSWYVFGRGTTRQSTQSLGGVVTGRGRANATADSMARAATAPASAGSGLADPEDSGVASLYTVRLGSFDSYRAALRELRAKGVRRGAATITPVVSPVAPDAAPAKPQSFVLYAGASHTQAPLEQAAAAWVGAQAGASAVVKAPYALRLATALTLDSARSEAVSLRAAGVPAYVLVAAAKASVYAGAFGTPEESKALLSSLTTAGLKPELAFRVGQAP